MSDDGTQLDGAASSPEGVEVPEQKKAPLVLWVLPLVVAVLLPGMIWVVSSRPLAIQVELALGMAVPTALVALALLAALTGGFRRRWRWALGVASTAILVLFQWPAFTLAGKVVATYIPIPLLKDVFPVVVACGFIWVASRRGGELSFAALLAAGSMTVFVVLIAAGLPDTELATPAERGTAPPGSPDVVLLILDGYTRADVLEDEFNYDNAAFLEDLVSLDFEIASDANANYSFTYASIASMFELGYVYELGPVDSAAHGRMRHALSGAPEMFDVFREAGYEIAFVENAWAGSHCGAAVDVCRRDGFTERVLWNVSDVTIFAPLVRSIRPNPFNSVSLEHLSTLPEIVGADRSTGLPRLTVIHALLPHSPFLRDATCEYHNSPLRRAIATPSEELVDQRRAMYSDQLECTNDRVLDAMRAIATTHPDTLIMITGDHGSDITTAPDVAPEDWSDAAVRERMGVLSAYRLPGCEEPVYPSITPVNGTRLLVNCALGIGLEPLPDRTLWAPFDGEGTVIDIGERIAAGGRGS